MIIYKYETVDLDLCILYSVLHLDSFPKRMNEIGAVQADIIRTHSTRMLCTGCVNAAKSFDRGANSKCLRRLSEAIRQDHIQAR